MFPRTCRQARAGICRGATGVGVGSMVTADRCGATSELDSFSCEANLLRQFVGTCIGIFLLSWSCGSTQQRSIQERTSCSSRWIAGFPEEETACVCEEYALERMTPDRLT